MFLLFILDIFRRSKQHQALSPAERAFLRFVDGLVVFVFLSVVVTVVPMLKGDQPFDLHGLIRVAALAFFQVIGMTLMKLWKAQGDNGISLQSSAGTLPAGLSSSFPPSQATEVPSPAATAAAAPLPAASATAVWEAVPGAPPAPPAQPLDAQFLQTMPLPALAARAVPIDQADTQEVPVVGKAMV